MNRNPQPIIWFALVTSLVTYVFIAWITVGKAAQRPLAEAIAIMPVPVLYAMGLMMFVAAFAAGRFLAPRDEFQTPGTSGQAEAKRRTARIAQWAMLESICVLGLMAAFIVQTWTLILPPFAASLAGFVMTFPSAQEHLSS
ncbi:MAG: hypothetical protein ACYC7A_16455 [Thermoanaerobaculia bacterium]